MPLRRSSILNHRKSTQESLIESGNGTASSDQKYYPSLTTGTDAEILAYLKVKQQTIAPRQALVPSEERIKAWLANVQNHAEVVDQSTSFQRSSSLRVAHLETVQEQSNGTTTNRKRPARYHSIKSAPSTFDSPPQSVCIQSRNQMPQLTLVETIEHRQKTVSKAKDAMQRSMSLSFATSATSPMDKLIAIKK